MSLEQGKCINITKINSQNSGRISVLKLDGDFLLEGIRKIARAFESDKRQLGRHREKYECEKKHAATKAKQKREEKVIARKLEDLNKNIDVRD